MKSGLIFFRMAGYLRFLAASRGLKGHGIHSPFVYDLVTRVMADKNTPAGAGTIEMIRRDLKRDRRVIEPADLKRENRSSGERQRRVSEIARVSPVPEKYGLLLHNLAAEFGGDLILEFGTSLGISTMYMSLAAPDVPLFTMEGSDQAADVAEENFRNAGMGNIRVFRGLFRETLPLIIDMGVVPGMVFIDGDHRKEALLSYFDAVAGIAGNDTLVVVDDINYSGEMADAWKEIMRHEKVTLAIDLYRMGLVFFRKGMAGSRYVIRY
jgi:predicted O-methyltransferase YrrM